MGGGVESLCNGNLRKSRPNWTRAEDEEAKLLHLAVTLDSLFVSAFFCFLTPFFFLHQTTSSAGTMTNHFLNLVFFREVYFNINNLQ